MKKYSWIGIGVLGVCALLVLGLLRLRQGYPNWNGKDDLRIGIIGENGMGIVAISPERRMVNVMKIDREVKVWVPFGYGDYMAGKVEKLLKSEGKNDYLNYVYYYNFGFWPDVVLKDDKIDNWQNFSDLCAGIGLENYLKYRSMAKDMLYNEEMESGEIKDNPNMAETLPRDFADNRLVDEEYRLTLRNNSGIGGLASWLANKMEASGIVVVGLETGEVDENECEIVFGKEAKASYTMGILRKVFWGCDFREDEGFDEMEIEMNMGKSFASMLKYVN